MKDMLEQTCVMCEKKFLRKRSQVLLGGGNYCSNTCRYAGRKNGKLVLCMSCATEIYRPLRQLKGSKSGKYFCSKVCLFKWIYKKYDGHPNWKNGHSVDYRTKLIKNDDKKHSCFLCKEDNLKMLAVHHVDKDRLNNSINNLVWLCHNCHFLIHHYKNEEEMLTRLLNEKV